jgi:UDP-arabinose 4-epimerase
METICRTGWRARRTTDPETHLIPRAILAAKGDSPDLTVFGGDYPTEDGTCVRDYIHVADLARAHLLALAHLTNDGENIEVNLGSGRGHSVNEILDAIERITGLKVPAKIEARRPGDPPVVYADARLALETLRFTAVHSELATIITTAARSFGLETIR